MMVGECARLGREGEVWACQEGWEYGVMLGMPRLLAALLVPSVFSVLSAAEPAAPTVNDAGLKIELFAQEPLVQQPIGMTFTQDGKLLVIQSNTHFRPKNYAGPEHDRVLWLV